MLLEPIKQPAALRTNKVAVNIAGIATAVPKYKVTQDDVSHRAQTVFPQFARLDGLYKNTGIDIRYACEPTEWYLVPRTWEERTESFHRHSLALLEDVAHRSIAAAGLQLEDIDVVVTNTITGLAIPSLEARLMNRMAFRPDVERLPIFGFGCGGGVAGLARAAKLAKAEGGQNVLFLTIDLCSLCLRVDDPSLAMFVSCALFGDGAAAVVLRSNPSDTVPSEAKAHGRIGSTGEHFWSDTEHIMGWDIKNDGFGVVLSPELPTLMREKLSDALFAFLNRSGLTLEDFDGFLFHPGGRKVLETAQQVLGLSDDDLRYSWDILRDYGNMSSATALFILQHAIKSGARGRHLLTAFGPGFSAYFVVLDL